MYMIQIFTVLKSTKLLVVRIWVAVYNFHFLTGATAYSQAYFGHGSGPILLDNVRCTGRESRLLDCSKYGGVGFHDCSHREDAGVRCNGTTYLLLLL